MVTAATSSSFAVSAAVVSVVRAAVVRAAVFSMVSLLEGVADPLKNT